MLLTTADIYRRIFQEIVVQITRFEGDDDTENIPLQKAMRSAEKEAKMYLSRFDTAVLFGDGDDQPDEPDIFLTDLCADIAVFRLVNLGTPGIDYEIIKTNYSAAIKTLKGIQDGTCMPEGWTYIDTTGEDAPNGNSIEYFSNEKSSNHF